MAETINIDGSGRLDIVLNEDYDFSLVLLFPVDITGTMNMFIAPEQGEAITDTIPFVLSGSGNRTATLAKLATSNTLVGGVKYYEIENNKGGGSHQLMFSGNLTINKRSRV